MKPNLLAHEPITVFCMQVRDYAFNRQGSSVPKLSWLSRVEETIIVLLLELTDGVAGDSEPNLGGLEIVVKHGCLARGLSPSLDVLKSGRVGYRLPDDMRM